MNPATTEGEALPKRFMLLPGQGSVLQVMMAAQCVGYVWTEEERWLARGRDLALLDTGSGKTVYEAVAAVFERSRRQVFSRAQ